MGLTEGLTLGRDDGRRSPAQIDRSDFPNLGLEVSDLEGSAARRAFNTAKISTISKHMARYED